MPQRYSMRCQHFPLFTHFDYYALVCRHDSNSPSNLSHFQLDSYGLMNQFYCPQTYEYWINDCLLKQISILCHILIEIMCYSNLVVLSPSQPETSAPRSTHRKCLARSRYTRDQLFNMSSQLKL